MSLRSIALSPVSSYTRSDFPVVDAKESISNLLGIFADTKRYELPVKKNGVMEIVTVRDVLKVDHPERTCIAKIAKRPPRALLSDSVAQAVDKIVRNRIRLCCIFDDRDAFVGFLLQMDLLDELADVEELKHFPADEVMVENPITTDRNASAAVVRSLMLGNDISHIPLMSRRGVPKGIVTARDLVTRFIQPRESLGRGDRVGEKLSKWSIRISGIEDEDPVRASPRASLYRIAQRMRDRKKSCCIVVEKRRLMGIITPREILALLREFKAKKRIPVYVLGVKNVDPSIVGEARSKIMRLIRRGIKIHPEVQEVVIRARKLSKTGGRTLYKLKGRVYLPKEVFHASSKAWSLRDAFDQLCDKLDRQLRGL